MFKVILPVLVLVGLFSLTSAVQQKPIFEKMEIRKVNYGVAVAPGAFPKGYGYFNKAFKFNQIDPLELSFSKTDTADLALTHKILEEQLGNYLKLKKIEMAGTPGNKVHAALKPYSRQCMTLSDKSGNRYMCMNFFCEPERFNDNWLHSWIEVKDGGTCHWHMIFSLTKKSLLFAHPNGD